MYDRILMPTDGSLGMASAIEQGFHQARESGATVHALYVVDLRAYVMLPEATRDRVRELLAEEGRRALGYLEERAADEGVELVAELQEGVPYEVILQYADEHEVDLVVMGTHGQTGDQQRIVGSVAEEVVRHAVVPVMTVRMREEDAERIEAEVPEQQSRYIA